MTHRIHRTFIIALALALPIAALADVNGTATISSGSDFSFDNGTSTSSGGDIKFSGTSITVVGSAKLYDLGPVGSAGYSEFPPSDLSFLSSEFSTAPINGGSLAANEVFAVHTNGGNYATVLIVSVSSSSLKLQYDAAGSTVTGGTPTPTVTAVLDAGSYTQNIAQGSVFVVKGSDLSPSGIGTNGLLSTAYPLPQSSNGVSINIAPASGGSGTPAYIVYLFNSSGVNQLAAILPSTISPGNYNLTVANGGASSQAFPITVVARKPGLVTQDSTGNGLVVAQNYVSTAELDINRFTKGSQNGSTISPAYPGQTLIVWLTGMGPVPFADNTAPDAGQGYDFTKNGATVVVYVGGMAITPFYGGRAPCCAGEDQIDVTLPDNVPTGCTVAFQISVNGILSQPTFISIAPSASASACVLSGFTTAQLQAFDNGATITTGSFSLFQEASSVTGLGSFTVGEASGGFVQFTGFELAGAPGGAGSGTLPSACTVTQIPVPSNNLQTIAIGTGTSLDAGAVTLTGPSGSGLSNAALTETSDVYSLTFQGEGSTINGNLVAGAYTVNGAGGTGIGKFNATVTMPAPFTVTNLPTAVNRSAGLTLNWTGGNSSDFVGIYGSATNAVNGVQTGASFLCYTTAGAGVPIRSPPRFCSNFRR